MGVLFAIGTIIYLAGIVSGLYFIAPKHVKNHVKGFFDID